MEEASPKHKINKSHKSIDYAELEYSPHRKGSDDSLGSQRSVDSQYSSDSHSSVTVRELNKDISSLKKHDQWSSVSTRSEADSEGCATTHSAPPVMGEKFSIYDEFSNDSVWLKRSEQSYMPRSSQTPGRSQVKRDTKYVNETVRIATDALKSLPPIRRQPKDAPKFPLTESDFTAREIYYAYDRTPSKAEEILGKPEAPVRNTRKPKRTHVKSLGEEVTDSSNSSLEKNQLGTIDESKVIHPDLSGIKTKSLQKDVEASMELLRSEGEVKQSLTPKRQRSSLSLDLRRRNSDPATKITLVSGHPSGTECGPQIKASGDYLEWQNRSTFIMAGHRFRKINRFTKDDKCAFCNKEMDAFITQGHKCTDCKKLFHTKCIQNKNVLQMPCDFKHQTTTDGKPSRRKYRKHSRAPYDLNKQAIVSKFNLTGTSEFTDRADQIISDANELQLMQDFITNKICKIESEAGEKPSEVDILFKQALREFKDNLVQIYSAASKQGYECSIKYKDLITNFMQAMETVCQREMKDKDFPVTMGVNAFRGFMDEFMSSRSEADKPSKAKRKKEKKRKGEDTILYGGHTFLSTIINIPTACEICNSFFMWPIERGLVCQSCRLTCHKKCHKRTTSNCTKETTASGESRKVFGVPLATLLTEDTKVPVVIEKLLTTIEMCYIYTEGIYRKSGVSSKIRELKVKMEENPEEVNFENYQVHVLASVFKSFLREMPEPLLTFECYENFITAANLDDPQDRVTTLYDILKKLPTANYDLMERLMFHLARIALHENVNRMSPASLAIVFAPCILRTNKVVPAQDSLQDIGSQTQCIETIIRAQLEKIRTTLEDIDTLDTARQAATNRLSSLRVSKVFTQEELLAASQSSQQHAEDEEHLLVDHIQEIQKEKEHLTSTLPTLTHATSDDDMLSTDGDGSLDDISCVGEQKKTRVPVVRSISGGDSRQSLLPRLKRQSSSDVSVKVVDECEDAPIMV